MKKTLALLSLMVLLMAALTPGAQATMLQPSNTWDQLLQETLKAVEGLGTPAATLTVNGTGSITAVPDMAVINAGISVEAKQVADAQEQVNTVMNDILSAMGELGIAEEHMATSSYSVYPMYDYADDNSRTLRGYQVSNQLNITVVDFAQINDVLDTAVEKGANEIGGLSFDVADKSTYYQQALTSAVAQATAKAQTLAQASGKTLGALVEVTEGTSGYSAYAEKYMPMADEASGATNIQAGQLEISATVQMVYQLQ